MRRSTWVLAVDSNQFRSIVLDRADHRLLSRVPPLIVENAVAVRISAGRQSGVPGGGAGIGVLVIAVGKIGAAIQQKSKTTLAELIAKTFQVIRTKLVDHKYDDQLRVGIVGRAKAITYEKRKKQDWDYHHAEGELH